MKDLYHKFLKKIAHFQVEKPFLAVALLLALTIAIWGGVSQVRTVASLEQMMPKEVEEIRAFNELRDNHLGQDMLAIVIAIDRDSTIENGITDIRDQRVYNYVKELKTQIQTQPDIIEAYAFSDLIEEDLTQTQYNQAIKNPAIKEMLSNYINVDYSITIILATTDVSADDPRMNLLSEKIKQITKNSGSLPSTKTYFTGTPIIQQRLGELISQDRNNTQWISTLLVFLITMIIFGSFTSAVVPIIVVTISINWLYGTMGYSNLPISTLAGGVAAMVIGIGIDFAIHIINKFKYERKKGLNIKDSIEAAVVETGTALSATSLTTISAFLAFLFGAMPEMGRFGMLMAIGIFYALIFSLYGLPAILVLEEKLIYFLKDKMKFGIESEFHLEEDKRGEKK
jgi:predicted RND superfamily exporter protein